MNERSKQIRRDTIKLMREYNANHYGGSFSCIEILIALYDHVLKEDDIFILSKGHSCWAYYVLLREKGFNPVIEGHPHLDTKNGIYATTGSMGHGLPFGIGVALAKKIKEESGRVFVLMGDGECQEGTLWESLLIIKKLELNNLFVIIDHNKIQMSDFTDNILSVNFDYFVDKTVDGHNINDIKQLFVYEKLEDYYEDKPQFILANTIKGKGISFMENNPEWHSKWLADEMMKKALEELK